MSTATTDRLTALDESFLHMEHAGLPMHVASAATFEAGPLLDADGQLRIDDIMRHIESRAALLPRLRQRLWIPLGGIDHARWVDDEDFDIRRHVDVVEAPAPGDDAVLRQIAAEAESELLDRDHPLWHMRFVTGLTDDRVGLIQRTHHAMVDGVSGVDVAAVVLDLTPDPGPDVVEEWHPGPPPTSAEAVLDVVRDALEVPGRLLQRFEHTLRHPVSSLQHGQALVEAFSEVVTNGLTAPDCSLNVPVGPRRELAWIRTDLPALKRVGRAANATLNDVVLTAVAGGLRSLLLHRGDTIPADCSVKVLVPVSLRADEEHGALGNRVAAYLLPLPIGVGDPHDRLEATSDTMHRLKGHHEESASDVLLGVINQLPVRLSSAIARTVGSQPFVNLVITNVPGPREPLYLVGSRMLEAFPIVPLGGNLSLGVAILSYGDGLNIGVTVDPDACPDVAHFVDGVDATLDALGAR